MRAFLTSAGITNGTLRDALVDLLGKPVSEASALFVPTAVYPFPGGGGMAWDALLPALRSVYVGVSAGSIAATGTFVETYVDPPGGADAPLSTEKVVFDGGVDRILATGRGAGLVDFAVIPHYGHPDHPDASPSNAEQWAARIPAPTYAIDDDTAVKVVDGAVEVVSAGQWKLFPA